MITAAGVGSGIDIESILSQLDVLGRQPVEKLNEKRAALDVELSAYGTAKGALSGFKTAVDVLASDQKFGAFVATSSDEAVFTAVSTGGDIPESHEVEVKALATNQRLTSNTAYADENDSVAQGTLNFSSVDNQFQVVIGSGNSTLLGLRDAINDSLENTSVSASIVNVDNGSRLVLTAKNSGTQGSFTVSVPNLIGPDSPADFSTVNSATDAELVVHGFDVTSSSNSISDVIDGVTLNLTGLGKSTFSTARDTTSLRESLDEFVVKYNAMTSTLNDLAQKDLQGDRLPRGVESRMRTAFQGGVDLQNGDSTTALSLGFTFDRYGTLSIDDTAFNSALDDGVSRYVEAFANTDTGLATRFSDLIQEYTQAGGIISVREDGVDARKSNIDDQIDRLEYRLDKVSARLRAQFTAMDMIVTNLNTTSGYLANQLGNNNYQ